MAAEAGGIPALLDALVHRIHPDAGRREVALALDLVGSLLGPATGAPPSLPAPAALEAAKSHVDPADSRAFERVRRRIEPMALSEAQT